MTERPTIRVLVCRAVWDAATPDEQLRRAHFAVIDLLTVYDWLRRGYRPIGVDPEDEAAWRVWRANNPEAA